MKRLMIITVIAIIAVAAGWNFNQSKNEVTLSDFTLDNVEALAAGETIRCVDSMGSTLFYCKPALITACYCSGARPGQGYEKTYNP